MADEAAQLSFPLPPVYYYRHYTDENVWAKRTPPPPPVISGEYSMYGHTFKTDDAIIQPLESQGIKRLYSSEDDFDHIVEMKKLNHSILLNYLELIDILIEAPASPDRLKKIEEIKVLFINLHHLINEFRPHQARETLRVMLYRQKQKTLDTTERLKLSMEKAQSILRATGSNLNATNATSQHRPDDKTEGPSSAMEVDVVSSQQQTDSLQRLRQQVMCAIADTIS